MAQTFKEHWINFREQSAAQGLQYTLSVLFSTLPASFGHLIDIILGLDGSLFDKNKKNHLTGYFGFALGIIPFLTGYIAGQILQIAMMAPSYIGHYFLDKPIRYALTKLWDNASFATRDFLFFISLFPQAIYETCFMVTAYLFGTPPKEMNDFFGFVAGFLPHVAQFFIVRLAGVVTCSINMLTDYIGENLASLLKKEENAAPANQTASPENTPSNPTPDAATPQPAPTPNPETPRRPRFRTNRTAPPPATGNDPLEGMGNKDLFRILQMDANLYLQATDEEAAKKLVKDAYKKLALKYHPDKVDNTIKAMIANEGLAPENAAARKEELLNYFNDVQKAQQILQNPAQANLYRRNYQAAGGLFASSSRTSTSPANNPQIPAPADPQPSRPRFRRPQ